MNKLVIELTAQELELNLNLLATHPWNQVNALIQNLSTQAAQNSMQAAQAGMEDAPPLQG